MGDMPTAEAKRIERREKILGPPRYGGQELPRPKKGQEIQKRLLDRAFRTGWAVVKGESDDFSSVMPTWMKEVARSRKLSQGFRDINFDENRPDPMMGETMDQTVERYLQEDIEDDAMDFAEPAVNDALESIGENVRSKDMPMPMRRNLTQHNTKRRWGI